MLKKTITLSIIFIVFLAACQSASTSPTALSSTQVEPTRSSQGESSTQPPPLPEVSPTPSIESTGVQAEANCTVISRQPTPGPTEQSIIPPVSDSDWTQGPEDAKVTIIEYGDFQ
jgi:hypothetical protein